MELVKLCSTPDHVLATDPDVTGPGHTHYCNIVMCRLSLTIPHQQLCLTTSQSSCSAPMHWPLLQQQLLALPCPQAQLLQPQCPCRSAASWRLCRQFGQTQWWCWPLPHVVLRRLWAAQLCKTQLVWCHWTAGRLKLAYQQAHLPGEWL